MRISYIGLISFFLCSATVVLGDYPPMPTHYVEDQAGIISDSYEKKLNQLLDELEQKTGSQFIVLTINTTGLVSIEKYSLELANLWALGQKGVNNGFLFTIAFSDRKYRFETGYGLETAVPEGYLDRLGERVLTPAMRKGRYSEGIYESALAVANKIAVHYEVSLSGIPEGYCDPGKMSLGALCLTWGIPILLFGFLFLAITGRGSVLWPVWLVMGRHYNGSCRSPFIRRGFWYDGGHGYGGGGFGNGGFGSGGSFGGGGGGGFGGSGSSGGW